MFGMKRIVLLGCLLTLGAFALASCATDEEEPFPVHGGAHADEPVAGASAPPRDDPSAGWKW